MSIYITPQDELHVEYQGIAVTCPHCQTLTHLTPVAVPKFEELMRRKPKHVGIVFRCDTCIEPIFLKFAVKAYTALRVELSSSYIEIVRAREHFPLTYLPEEAEELFKEALNCYSAGCFNAFGSMSRRTAQSLFRELGERGKLELFDTLQEIRSLAHLDFFHFARRAIRQRQRSLAQSSHPERGTGRNSIGSDARPALSNLRAQSAFD